MNGCRDDLSIGVCVCTACYGDQRPAKQEAVCCWPSAAGEQLPFWSQTADVTESLSWVLWLQQGTTCDLELGLSTMHDYNAKAHGYPGRKMSGLGYKRRLSWSGLMNIICMP